MRWKWVARQFEGKAPGEITSRWVADSAAKTEAVRVRRGRWLVKDAEMRFQSESRHHHVQVALIADKSHIRNFYDQPSAYISPGCRVHETQRRQDSLVD